MTISLGMMNLLNDRMKNPVSDDCERSASISSTKVPFFESFNNARYLSLPLM